MKNKLILTAIFLMLESGCAMADTLKLTDATAIIVVIGEAESESQTGRIAVAEVTRKRGSLKGIYGANAIIVKDGHYYRKTKKGLRKIDDATVTLSKAAWFDSRHTNYSKDADGWGNANDIKIFKRQAWFKNCIIVAHIGNHYFWKKV
jgi:hypothetical protein